jgi:hypothetical protein
MTNRLAIMRKILNRLDMGYVDTLNDAVDELKHLINLGEGTNLNHKECEKLFLSYCSTSGRQDVK